MKKTNIKKLLVAVAIATATNVSFAQTPYDSFAPSSEKKEMLKLPESTFRAYSVDATNGVKYIELDKEVYTVSYFNENDSLIKTVQLEPTTMKWLSIDPLASKYPSHSPYNFVVNNPINAYDPDGRDVVFLIDKEGASGSGHMGMLFQNKNGNWNYFTQGAAENGSMSGFLSGSNYNGGVGIMPMQTVTKSGAIINMTKEQAIAFVTAGKADGTKYDNSITLKTSQKQDGIITQNAYALQKDFQTKSEQYNVYTNNCVDACQDVVEGTKGTNTNIMLPSDPNPKPNEYFKSLQSSIPWMNGELKMVTIPSTMDNIPAKQIVVPNIQTP